MTEKIMDEIVWLAEFMYGSANLSKVTVSKRTPKRVYVKSRANILGTGYYGITIDTERKHIFETPEEALYFLIDEAREYRVDLERKIRDTDKVLDVLQRTLERLKKRSNGDVEVLGED